MSLTFPGFSYRKLMIVWVISEFLTHLSACLANSPCKIQRDGQDGQDGCRYAKLWIKRNNGQSLDLEKWLLDLPYLYENPSKCAVCLYKYVCITNTRTYIYRYCTRVPVPKYLVAVVRTRAESSLVQCFFLDQSKIYQLLVKLEDLKKIRIFVIMTKSKNLVVSETYQKNQ